MNICLENEELLGQENMNDYRYNVNMCVCLFLVASTSSHSNTASAQNSHGSLGGQWTPREGQESISILCMYVSVYVCIHVSTYVFTLYGNLPSSAGSVVIFVVTCPNSIQPSGIKPVIIGSH